MHRPGAKTRTVALIALALLGAACGSTAPRPVRPEVDLHHPSATRRLEAIAAVAETHDTALVPDLIGRLDDPDVGVRMAAQQALTSLTGRVTAYRPYAGAAERAAEVEGWRAWWAAQGRASPAPAGASVGGGGYTGGPTHVARP